MANHRYHLLRSWLLGVMAGMVASVVLPLAAMGGGIPSTEAVAEFTQGKALYGKRDFAGAANRFQKALALAPDNSEFTQWLGRAYGLQAQNANLLARPGLAARSRETLERAVALDPDNLGARSDLAAYYAAAPGFMGGSSAKARAQVAEIRRRDPYLGELRAGDLAWDDHRPADAEQRYRAAVELDPRRPEARGRLGYFFTERKQYQQAFEQWDAILAADPNAPRALYGLGRTAALAKERAQEGEAALRTCLQLDKFEAEGPSPARAHYYLGLLLEQRGDGAGSRREYGEAIRLNPRLTEAKEALARSSR